MKHKYLLLLLSLTLMLQLGACNPATTSGTPKSTATASDQSKFTWQITVENSNTINVLNTTAGIGQYDGSSTTATYEKKASVAFDFLIVTLNINKTKAGGKKFLWDNLSVKDAKGKAFPRMNDDTFLTQHKYSRIPGTDLTLGGAKGSICFEIPSRTAASAYALTYDAGIDGINTLPLS